MRKPVLILAALAALAAYSGAGGSAVAAIVVDPSCDGDPYSNDFAIHDLELDVTQTPVAHAPSGVKGAGLVCGTAIDSGETQPGKETLNDNADIVYPPGLSVNPTVSDANPGGIPIDSFVGNTKLNVASWAGSLPLVAKDQRADIFADTMTNCEAENLNTVGGPVPGTVAACYIGETTGLIPGHAWIWVTQGAGGGYTLTIGPFYNDLTDDPAGLTDLKDFTLCTRAGVPGSTACGTGGDPWIGKNGDASLANCLRGAQGPNGVYSLTVTNKAGQTVGPASVCVRWIGLNRVQPGGGLPNWP